MPIRRSGICPILVDRRAGPSHLLLLQYGTAVFVRRDCRLQFQKQGIVRRQQRQLLLDVLPLIVQLGALCLDLAMVGGIARACSICRGR